MTATATDELALLEFDPTLPCENSIHDFGDEPARLLVRGACAGCHRTKVAAICQSCWDRAARLRFRHTCGQTGTRDECWAVIRTIGGA